MVVRELLADCETPVSAFRKIDQALGGGGSDAFLLESVEGGEVWGRYSILSAGIARRLVFAGGRARLEGAGGGELGARDPLAALREVLGSLQKRPAGAPPSPGPFPGGAVGFLAYDAVRHYARVGSGVADPEAVFLLPEAWLIFDALKSRISVVGTSAEAVGRLEEALSRPLPASSPRKGALEASPFDLSDQEFGLRVERAREYVKAGDVIQVVLSRRREGRFAGDPFDVYRALRLVNPSPYMFFLRAGKKTLAGSSPEALVRVKAGRLTTRPIAGTRPRAEDPAVDLSREKELLADEKERAEHLMLVDLGRNDLGRVAVTGSVEVPSFMRVERYSHVMHLVSEVVARLAPGKDALDAAAAVFPAVTLSGAPKIRAMQIVSELEGKPRGVYGGLVGWFGLDGDADTAIAIRMVEMEEGRFRVQAGAGIVYDSDPRAEAAETAAKAEGVMAALGLAAGGLALP